MKAIRILSAAAVVLMLSVPQSAHARFGKRSSGSGDSEDSSRKTHKAVRPDAPSSAPSHRHHEARPVHHESRPVIIHHERPRTHHHVHVNTYPSTPVYSYSHTYVAPAPAVVAVAPALPPPPPPAMPVAPVEPVAAQQSVDAPELFVGVSAQGNPEGAILGLGVGVEGKRWGLNGAISGILASDGVTLDAIQVFDARLSYAFVSTDWLRLRVEGGVSAAVAPDLAVAGPDIGVSASLRVLGPVGLAASAYTTPFPFGKLDTRAAATLALDALQLQAGWRTLVLDDYGAVGERHVDEFSGPFVGMALAL